MSSAGSKLNREKRRRAATYRRGYEDGVAARNDVPTDAQPVAWLRHGEETFVQNIPFGAMWISDKDDPRAFPVFERAQQPAPSVAVKALEWDAREDGSHCGTSSIGHYHVFLGTGFSYDLCGPVGGRLSTHKRLSEAKAAAQADYATRIRSALSAQVQDVASPHPDDLAVDRFALAMKEKLAQKRAEGRGGWDNPDECSVEWLSELLIRHIEKGDPIDVGNFAMMIHQRGGRISR